MLYRLSYTPGELRDCSENAGGIIPKHVQNSSERPVSVRLQSDISQVRAGQCDRRQDRRSVRASLRLRRLALRGDNQHRIVPAVDSPAAASGLRRPFC